MLDLFPGGVEEERDGDDVVLAGYADEAPADGLDSDEVEPGWEDRWRAYHRPVTVGRVWVGPPWAGDCPHPDGDSPHDKPIAVVIDPGRAFGTGGHGSTRARRSTSAAARACSPSRRPSWASGRSRASTATRWPSARRPRTPGETASRSRWRRPTS